MIITNETIQKLIPSEHHDLVFKFFVSFSRFEYALKRANFITGSEKHVEAAWDCFAGRYCTAFNPSQSTDLNKACEYFKENPPRKQILRAGVLDWSEIKPYTKGPFLTWLLTMVRRVRNNLFHGGKFPIAVVEDPTRNRDLLNHSLTILDACLSLNDDVRGHF